tara:strand:- start:3 stop:3671 length:3669 start_codon:yes stop_codon:yes gene_type:complete
MGAPPEGIPEGYEVRNKLIRKKEPAQELPPEQAKGLEAEDIPLETEAPFKPPPEQTGFVEEIIFASNKANQKHNKALKSAHESGSPEQLAKKTKNEILATLTEAGVKIKDPKAAKTVLARSLYDHVEASRKRAVSVKNRSKGKEVFDREKLNEQERLGYIAAQYGGVDATQFRKYGGTRGEDGLIHSKTETYDPFTVKKTTKKRTKKDEMSKDRRTPGTQDWVKPLREDGGLGIDQIHKSMIEDGHIPRDMDVSEFYDLLREDLQNNNKYSDLATDRVSNRGEQDFDSLKSSLDEDMSKLDRTLKEDRTPTQDEGYRPDRRMKADSDRLWEQNERKANIQGPTRPGETLSSFPDFNKLGDLARPLKGAYDRVRESLFAQLATKKTKGLYEKAKKSLFEEPDSRTVVSPEGTQTLSGKQVGLNVLRGIMSPNQAANIFSEFKPYFILSKRAESMQHKFSQMTHKRMKSINEDIGENPVHKKEYSEVLVMGDMMGKQFSRAELSEMEIAPNVQSAYLKTRSYFDHILTMMNKHLVDSGKEPIKREVGYVPHFFHDWFIKVDGEMLPTAKTWSEAVSRTNKIMEENPNAKIRIYPKNGGQFEKLDMFGGDKYKTTLADMDYMITQDSMIGKFEMDPLEASELMDGLFNMPGRKRFLGNLLDRRGVKGWEKDVSFMVQHYGNITGRFIALDRFKKSVAEQAGGEGWRLDQDQSGVRKYIKDYVDDINGNPTAIETMLSKLPIFQKKGFIGRHLSGDRPIAKIASGSSSTMAITKLGLYNVSAAVVNASQIMNTNALIGPRFTKIGLEKAKMFDKGKMSTRDKGIVKQLMIEEQLGLEHDVLMSDAHSMGKIFNATTRLFQGVEQFNRRTVGLGAYYKFIAENGREKFGLLEKGPENNRVLQHKAALEYASKQIDKSQFDYGLFDTPGFIRRSGPLGSIAFQFKKFPIKQTEFLLNLKGAEAKRFWASYGIVVGLTGLPGANFVIDMVKENFGYDIKLETQQHLAEWSNSADGPIGKAAREHISTILLYGLPSEAGVNVSGRVGISDIIPQNLSDLAGPMPNTIVRAISDMAKEEQNGKWAKVLKDIASGPGNVAVALQGKTYGRRGRKITDLTPQEMLTKSLGFRTTRETREVDQQNMIRYSEKKTRALRSKYVDRAINAIENDRKQDLGGIGKDWAKHNLGTSKSFVRAIKREMQQKRLSASQRQFFNQSKLGKYKNLPTYNLGR